MKTDEQLIWEQYEMITLYHGTSKESAKRLLKYGWKPYSGFMGSQSGNPEFLYLTTTIDNAKWYADEKGDGVVLEIKIPKRHLIVDPEDSTAVTVDEELNLSHGLPGCLAGVRPIPPSNIKIVK